MSRQAARRVRARWLLASVVAAALVGSSEAVPLETGGMGSAQQPMAIRGSTSLPATIAKVLDHPTLNGARLGIIATFVPEGDVLFSYNAEELFTPASVAKLFTTATALWHLGSHFVWETPIAHSGGRTGESINGDLWVLGRGAPDLVEERLWIAAVAIYDEGIRRVAGDLVVDDRYFDNQSYGKGWPGGRQRNEAYHAPISALMANFAARRGTEGWESVPDPALHFGQRLRDLLGHAGVTVEGIVRRPTPEERATVPAPRSAGTDLGSASVPSSLAPLYSIPSEPLGRLVMDINKFSNNVMAESVLKALGAIEYGPPGSATKGLALVARFLEQEVGIPLNSYVQADGSGLSPLDRFSPAQVNRLLVHVHSDFHIGPELVASLKLSGLDGWNPAPFKQPPLAGELRVKSGHIKGVNALSGFLHTRSGRVVAFCAMVDGHRSGQWEIDQRMAEIASILIRDY